MSGPTTLLSLLNLDAGLPSSLGFLLRPPCTAFSFLGRAPSNLSCGCTTLSALTCSFLEGGRLTLVTRSTSAGAAIVARFINCWLILEAGLPWLSLEAGRDAAPDTGRDGCRDASPACDAGRDGCLDPVFDAGRDGSRDPGRLRFNCDLGLPSSLVFSVKVKTLRLSGKSGSKAAAPIPSKAANPMSSSSSLGSFHSGADGSAGAGGWSAVVAFSHSTEFIGSSVND